MKTDIRKYLFAAATLALMLIATGCEKKAGMPGQAEGKTVETSICVNMPDYGTDVKSDAVPGDASYVNRCVMQAFIINEDGSLSAYGDRQTATVTGGKADFGKTGFVSGYDYKIVFWADYTENGFEDYFYDCSALPEVRLANENDIAFNNDRALLADIPISPPWSGPRPPGRTPGRPCACSPPTTPGSTCAPGWRRCG